MACGLVGGLSCGRCCTYFSNHDLAYGFGGRRLSYIASCLQGSSRVHARAGDVFSSTRFLFVSLAGEVKPMHTARLICKACGLHCEWLCVARKAKHSYVWKTWDLSQGVPRKEVLAKEGGLARLAPRSFWPRRFWPGSSWPRGSWPR